ncbi:MAG: glycosyltransferase [Bdellovibrionaceae bacterium]|nr:glycosyltransferase [Bdellovibrionales bacterium]MCB9083713.1 glycosyltransferase [Pseudobdellovibrionaceae bacterium]
MSVVILMLSLSAILMWIVYHRLVDSQVKGIPLLRDVDVVQRSEWPLVSVVITAKDEEKNIHKSLSNTLSLNYPNLEFIVVNDRSTDQTQEIIDQWQSRDSRLHSVQVKELPSGWVGKVHALQKGLEHARGEWVLFCDADVKLNTHTLEKAVSYCEQESGQHLGVMFDNPACLRSFWLSVMTLGYGALAVNLLRTRKIDSPDEKYFFGSGAFNLVKKSVLDQAKDLSWLRLELVDDMGLGMMVKLYGGKSLILKGVDEIGIVWYGTARDMMKGLEKNVFGFVGGFSLLRVLAMASICLFVVFFPLIGSLYFSSFAGVAAWVSVYFVLPGLITMIHNEDFNLHPLAVFFFPLAHLSALFVLVRSAFIVLKNQGVSWKDTYYPLSDLRQHQRAKTRLM